MSLNLYKHQKQILQLNPKKHLFAWQTGTGKTIAALELAKLNGANPLIIVPKSLKEQWQEQTDATVMTKEEFKRDCKKVPAHDCVIVDEAHHFSGHKSMMHKSLVAYIKYHKPRYVYLLTATPYLSTVFNIYALGIILGMEWNWYRFKMKFFTEIKMGHRMIPVAKKVVDGLPVKEHVANMVAGLGSTVKMEECVDLPEQTFKTEYFDLTPEQKRGIKDLDDVLPIVLWTKTHQICGGSLKGDGYVESTFYKSEKLNRLKELVQEHKKVIIVCRYNNEVNFIAREFKNSLIINGATKDKHEVLKKADALEECVLVVNAACSEGWEAPSFPTMIFYSYDLSLKNAIQMIGRIQRINKIKKNLYISLVVRGTIDEEVYKCILNKKDFDIAIYDKARK